MYVVTRTFQPLFNNDHSPPATSQPFSTNKEAFHHASTLAQAWADEDDTDGELTVGPGYFCYEYGENHRGEGEGNKTIWDVVKLGK